MLTGDEEVGDRARESPLSTCPTPKDKVCTYFDGRDQWAIRRCPVYPPPPHPSPPPCPELLDGFGEGVTLPRSTDLDPPTSCPVSLSGCGPIQSRPIPVVSFLRPGLRRV